MSDEPSRPAGLSALLHRLSFDLQQPFDFRNSDSGSTVVKVRLLTAAATYFNVLAVGDFGGRVGPARGDGLVEQAVAAAFQTFDGHEPHPSAFEKAAMLLRRISQGHPFNDGNKRTGFLLAAYLLERMGYEFPTTLQIGPAGQFCLKVSAGEIRDLDMIANALALIWEQ